MDEFVLAARDGALVVFRNDLATLEILGPDRASWLQGMVTNDVARLAPAGAVYTLALEKRGKIIADSIAAGAGDHIALSVHQPSAAGLLEHLDHFLVMEDAEIRSAPDSRVWVHVFGPASSRVLDIWRGTEGILCSASLDFGGHEGGVVLSLEVAQTQLLAKAESLVAENVRVVSLPAFDALRPDLGLPRFPVEFDSSCYPQEVGLDERAIAFNKGCYLGQEVVVKMRSRGHPSRTLVRLVIPAANSVPAPGSVVLDDAGADIGRVLSAAPSRLVDGVVAFAMLKWSACKPAAQVLVDSAPGRVVPAWGWIDQHSM